MPQGLIWDGKVRWNIRTLLCHFSETPTGGCHRWHHSFIKSHIWGCRGERSKQQDIFVALTKGGENWCVQRVGWGVEQRNGPCWAIFSLPWVSEMLITPNLNRNWWHEWQIQATCEISSPFPSKDPKPWQAYPAHCVFAHANARLGTFCLTMKSQIDFTFHHCFTSHLIWFEFGKQPCNYFI